MTMNYDKLYMRLIDGAPHGTPESKTSMTLVWNSSFICIN